MAGDDETAEALFARDHDEDTGKLSDDDEDGYRRFSGRDVWSRVESFDQHQVVQNRRTSFAKNQQDPEDVHLAFPGHRPTPLNPIYYGEDKNLLEHLFRGDRGGSSPDFSDEAPSDEASAEEGNLPDWTSQRQLSRKHISEKVECLGETV